VDDTDTRTDAAPAETEAGAHARPGTQRLSWSQRRFLALLGFPAFGLAFTVTAVSTYVPVLVEQGSGPLVAGLLVGGEGFFGIFVPALVGGLIDRRHTLGGRLMWLAVSGTLLVLAAAAVGFLGVAGAGAWAFGVALAVLYLGYYAYLSPYWALYPDLVPDEMSGRSRSAESSWRVVGVALALIGGGLLLSASPGLPFIVGAALVTAVTATLLLGLRGRRGEEVQRDRSGARQTVAAMRDLLRDAHIRNLVVANGLWNFALSALRAFVVLFFTVGLGRSSTFVATVIFPLVAVGVGVAAPLSGWLADRFGHVRLLTGALLVYGLAMAIPGITQATWVAGLIPVVAAGAATVMTLPMSMLMRLLPEERHGSASGLFGVSRGVGGTLGPLTAGAAIQLLSSALSDTHGYAVLWFVCSAALLASLPFLRRLRGDERL
jgi:MFS family permease